jgi:hypothetical protein
VKTKEPSSKPKAEIKCVCNRGSGCFYARNQKLCPQCPKCKYFGHTADRCCDLIISKCKVTQGEKHPGGNVEQKANSLARGAIVVDGVVYKDEILTNKAASASALYTSSTVVSTDKYACLDSGATGHLFKTRPITSSPDHDTVASPTAYISASGNRIVTSDKRMKVPLSPDVILENAELAPDVSKSLMSVYRILQQGMDVWFDHNTMTGNIGYLNDLNSPLLQAKEVNGSFHVALPTASGSAALASNYLSKKSTTCQRLHEGFAHVNFHHLLATVKAQASRGLPPSLDISNHSCTACILGKIYTQPFELHPPHYELLRELSADLSFPPKDVLSLGWATALMGIYDCGSSFTVVHPVRTKSEFA